MEMYLYVPLDGDRPWQSDAPPSKDQQELISKDQLHVFMRDGEGRDARYMFMDFHGEWDDVEFMQKQ